jgi:hypothetical protein
MYNIGARKVLYLPVGFCPSLQELSFGRRGENHGRAVQCGGRGCAEHGFEFRLEKLNFI